MAAYPKHKRTADPLAILTAQRRDGCCLWGLIAQDGCVEGYDVHHIEFKGAGGGDEMKNLICLCRKHHDQAQSRKIQAKDLRAVLTRFYGYTYTEAE
jgi:hypothetical protein